MGDVINLNNEVQNVNEAQDLVSITESLLTESKEKINETNTISMPLSELSVMGASIASMVPTFNTITQTMSLPTDGIYRLANAQVGDSLKLAKNGNYWGALKTAEGGSRFAQFQAVSDLSVTNTLTTATSVNPAMMMMAVALYSVEKEIKTISETSKQILSFLETEKESEIEADVEQLLDIIQKYKSNWDNEHFIAGNHKMVLDIQRTARKNVNFYKKQLDEMITSKNLLVAQSMVQSTLNKLKKTFRYYRLSLYIFSLASLLEIMLSGNFKESYIEEIKNKIENLSAEYRQLFGDCSIYLEKMSNTSVESNVMKGVGIASKFMGNLIGNIPVVKDGQVDEFLQDAGEKLTDGGKALEGKAVKDFALLSNPNTSLYIQKMNSMIQIYNHTDEICFDNENIYLISNS